MKFAVLCVTLPVYFQHFKNMSKDNNERHYGFKHIQPEYSWMTPGWIEELVKHEPDEEVRNHITEILEDLTNNMLKDCFKYPQINHSKGFFWAFETAGNPDFELFNFWKETQKT